MMKELEGSLRFWGDVFNPINYFDLLIDPTPAKAKRQARNAAIKSGIFTTAATAAWWLSSPQWRPIVGAPDPFRMFALKADTWRSIGQFAYRHSGNVALVSAPLVAATAGAIGYEKMVNEPIRKTHPGSRGTWFGPFASGFGPVV